jgi:hypothetical protein
MSDPVEPTTDDREKANPYKRMDNRPQLLAMFGEDLSAVVLPWLAMAWDNGYTYNRAPAGKPVVSREALAKAYHERFASEHVDHWDALDHDDPDREEGYDVADALLASGLFESRESVQAEARRDVIEWFAQYHRDWDAAPITGIAEARQHYGLEPAHD